MAPVERRARAGDVLRAPAERFLGQDLEPFDAVGPRLERAQQVERGGGLASPSQATARDAIAGTSFSAPR
jgi:hypothetical protein